MIADGESGEIGESGSDNGTKFDALIKSTGDAHSLGLTIVSAIDGSGKDDQQFENLDPVELLGDCNNCCSTGGRCGRLLYSKLYNQ
jgi:hypothetical protein